jgi:hypothetical protein
MRRLYVLVACLALAACNLGTIEPTSVPVPPTQQNVPIVPPVVETNAPPPTAQPQVQLVAQVAQPTAMPVPDVFEDQLDPVLLLASFYNAVNRREYQRAYGYWLSVPNQATLSQFSQGYADTASVVGLVSLPLREGVAAGSSYATMKTALLSISSNGSQQVFAGCYVGIKANVPAGDSPTPDPNWLLYDGRATPPTCRSRRCCSSRRVPEHRMTATILARSYTIIWVRPSP